METISWTDCVKNKEVLQRGKEDRNIPRKVKRRKANLIGHNWRRNCLLKHDFGGKIEGRKEGRKERGEEKTRKKT